MPEDKEFLQTITFSSLKFENAEDALRQYQLLPESVKFGMARCYKAFEEEPWFDPEYDMDELIKQEFPDMVKTFVPGALVIAKNMQGDVVGFASGGQTTVDALVKEKYKKEPPENQLAIKKSIFEQTGLTDRDVFMYENELVLLSDKNLPKGEPSVRNRGLGTELSKKRQEIFGELGYGAILGRSLNPYLLQMKENLFSAENGFRMTKFIPSGDRYTNPVTGTKRTIYFAARIR